MGPGYERPTVKAFVLHSNWQVCGGCGGKSRVCGLEAPPLQAVRRGEWGCWGGGRGNSGRAVALRAPR